MVGRILALLAGGAVPLLLALLSPPATLIIAAPLCVTLAAAPLLWREPSRWLEWSLGCGLACAATLLIPYAIVSSLRPLSPDQWPLFDLTTAPLPDDATGYVRVRGYVRDDWSLAEYADGATARPDQNTSASYVLMPLLASNEDVLSASGRVVVVRLDPNTPPGSEVRTIAGELRPIPRELVAALFTVGAPKSGSEGAVTMRDLGAFDDGPSEVSPDELLDAETAMRNASQVDSVPSLEVRDVSELSSVMLDATRRPTRGERLTDFVLSLVVLIGACWTLWRVAEHSDAESQRLPRVRA